MHNALLDAEKLQMQTVQVFTKNQQQWKCTPLAPAAISEWSAHRNRLKFSKTVSHASYLINLASPDQRMWEMSVALLIEELRRCSQLGIPYLVIHPGAHMGIGEADGLRRIAAALDVAHDTLSGDPTITCLEGTAGQGSTLGHRLEHLAAIIDLVAQPDRLGVCLDTAHLFAAGYDFRGKRYSAFRRQLGSTIGLRRVKVLHLNDSKRELGSRVDRHAHIGQGTIGRSGFIPLVRDAAFANTPKILETPKDHHPSGRLWDEVNLAALQRMLR